MNRSFLFSALVSGPLLLTAQAQTLEVVEPAPTAPRHRFGAQFRAGFNVGVEFSGRSGAAPGPATGGVDHVYDNGYVRVDDSGNAGGQTWNWGYDDASQLVGDNLVFTSGQAGRIDDRDESGNGFELSYAYRLGNPSGWTWGVEAAFNFMALSSAHSGASGVIIDSYATGGIIVPGAPYAGSAAGPGPLISDAPTRLAASLSSDLDASLYGFRLGPYVELPFSQWGSVIAGAGLSFVVVDSDLAYRHSATVPGAGTYSGGGAGTESDVLFGGYISAGCLVRFSERVNLLIALQYQTVGTFTQDVGDKRLELDLGNSLFLSAGVGFEF